MPAPLNVNREAVKTLAVVHGVREAARLSGLPQATVQAWSARFGWLKSGKPENSSQPICNQSPSNALTDSLARLGEETKHNLARAGAKASKHLARLKGAQVTRASGDFKNIVGGSAQLHGWDTRFQGTQFSLNVLNVGSFGVEINES